MSEQLKQQGNNAVIKVDTYNVYIDVGATTLKQHQALGNIPPAKLGTNGSRKPDQIITEGTSKNIYAIGEHKDTAAFNTEQKQMAALQQAVEVAELFKTPSVPIVYCSDGSNYIYGVLKMNAGTPKYRIVKTEDGYLFNEPLIFDHLNMEVNIDSIAILESIKHKTNDDGRFIVDQEVNPSNLATRVWQKTWIAKKCKPEQALSLFIEIFLLKYLSDLGILGPSTIGSANDEISFKAVFDSGPKYALAYYFNKVRPYIKREFPSNVETEHFYPTTIINGLPLSINEEDDSITFYGILCEFNSFGKLNNISKDFKTRLFEDFLKGTQIIAERGAYFTPRKVVQAIVDMADLPSYKGNSLAICDPACGVGGFIFEAMNKVKRKIKLTPDALDSNNYIFHGFDINEDDNHALTGVLGKANCLIYLSDKFSNKPTLIKHLSTYMNKTLFSYKNTKLGSLSEIRKEQYDLILTNPPYVTNGSGDVKESLKKKSLGYKFLGKGIQSMFMEKIVHELKTGGRAFVVLPDGFFNNKQDMKIRTFIFENCLIEALIGLPVKTFFNTPQKTYILVVRKMDLVAKRTYKTRKTFVYDALSIGETLDANRFDDYLNNDLKTASTLFKSFVNYANGLDYERTIEELEQDIESWVNMVGKSSMSLIDEESLLDRSTWIFKKDAELRSDDTEKVLNTLQTIHSDIYQLINLLRV